jgi:hypothetical protein
MADESVTTFEEMEPIYEGLARRARATNARGAPPVYKVRREIKLAKPTAIAASGIEHHQCSVNAESPLALSRPATKRPNSRRTAPSA